MEIYENTIVNSESGQTFIQWLNKQWGYTKSEYPIDERITPNPANPGATIKKKYYKCYGASIKYYRVYSK